MKSKLNSHIDNCLTEIISANCTIPSALLKNYFETACLLAKIEEGQERVKAMFAPNVIGDLITEPTIYKDKWFKCISENLFNHFIVGKWYKCINNNYNDMGTFIDEDGDCNGFYGKNEQMFDLSNPQDSDPTQNIIGSGVNDIPNLKEVTNPTC
jgi:hypothetical protein